jgi:hypothetical protein
VTRRRRLAERMSHIVRCTGRGDPQKPAHALLTITSSKPVDASYRNEPSHPANAERRMNPIWCCIV